MERFVKNSFWITLIKEHLFTSNDTEVYAWNEQEEFESKDPLTYANIILNEWNDKSNKSNPKNWSIYYKMFFSLEIGFLSLSVYIALAIYTPGVPQIMKELDVSQEVATLPLTMFVVAYGIGPMILSPITEYYPIGRNPVYIVTLFIFAVLQIPTAMCTDIASLCILRFISGFFASPVLATGGASVCDVILVPYMPVVIGIWAICSLCGPSLGPLIGAVLIDKGGWRWTFWFILIISGISFGVLGFCLPETYAPTLMYKRAKKLRKFTGNDAIRSIDELQEKILAKNKILVKYLWRPIEISIIEPVVLLINIYLALVYSVLYLWFEAFPIVYLDIFDFSIVEEGACFSSLLIGVILGSICYVTFIYFKFTLKLLRHETVYPEVFTPMGIVGGSLLPCGLFIFAWSSTRQVHWIGSLIGAVIAGYSNFVIFQTLLNYLGMSFPKYVASVFASNCLWRSVIAGVAPLFAEPLYNNLATPSFPVGWGSTILGLIALLMISIPVLFYLNGPKLRARSRFASNI
ncbi:uncharacterized protein PRCAT00002225001 [Priceomyces carsonii]|uniref:uncharacterized protein n=1 Tax=Priceomyces carsonii TaxID=28549 RepID=UPI002ED7EE0B|nr:unnamed protein product [Priceomyces carsonii]